PAEESGETRERRGKLVPKQYATREEADAVRAEAGRHPHIVRGTETSRTERRPEQPYTTSTLQQDASRKLRLSAKATMDRAQALFEAGAITYHRTDSTRLSDDAVQMARDFIAREHPESLPDSPNRARAKAGAQDAHEAIRPTQLGPGVTLPPDTGPLYEMIRARFLASQCKPALFDRTRITIDAGPTTWVAEGSVLVEPGFLVYWGPYARQEDVVLPAVAAGQQLTVEKLETLEKKTNPPPRYDQGALIKKLERSGIGRPATFAGIIDTLLKRDYVREMTAGRGKKVLQPTDLGMKLDGLMTAVFPALVTEEYTAEMERNLDEIEQGERSRLDYLRPWYEAFRAQMGTAVALGPAYRAEHQLAASRPRGATGEETTVTCDRCGGASYRKIARKGKKGSFLACPACGMTRDVRAKVKPGACRRCGAALIEKKIRGSVFFGCVRYGADEKPCDYRESADGAALGAGGGSGRYARAATDKSCPKCGKHKLVTLTPVGEGGTAFYACEDRACRFTLPLGAKRRRDPCPACGGVVLERRRKPTPAQQRAGETGAPFWACARWPACKFASDFTPSA
ncbi:MAG TPA: DNA topoisomerase, partial [Gemmatimonadaceae bacterium]|nr:DNA topoisomerase [Gemmatimonadaceae bacterium]